MDHLCRIGVLKFCSRKGINRLFQVTSLCKVKVHGTHVLIDDTPHVAAFSAQDPLYPQALGLGIHLGVELLHYLIGRKQTKVSSLRRVRTPGIVQPERVKQDEIAHGSVGAGIAKDISRGSDK